MISSKRSESDWQGLVSEVGYARILASMLAVCQVSWMMLLISTVRGTWHGCLIRKNIHDSTTVCPVYKINEQLFYLAVKNQNDYAFYVVREKRNFVSILGIHRKVNVCLQFRYEFGKRSLYVRWCCQEPLFIRYLCCSSCIHLLTRDKLI